MKVDVYESTENRQRYFIMAAGSDPNLLPEEVGNLVKSFDLQEDDGRIALPSSEALEAIRRNGYYVTEAKVLFTEE